MSARENKALVQRYIETVWNVGDLAAIDVMVDPDVVNHADPKPMPGRDRWRHAVLHLRGAFPDIRITIRQLVAEDELVVAYVGMRGTHQGTLAGVAPTGKVIAWEEMHLFRVRDGRIAEQWAVFDSLSLLRQLGAVPG